MRYARSGVLIWGLCIAVLAAKVLGWPERTVAQPAVRIYLPMAASRMGAEDRTAPVAGPPAPHDERALPFLPNPTIDVQDYAVVLTLRKQDDVDVEARVDVRVKAREDLYYVDLDAERSGIKVLRARVDDRDADQFWAPAPPARHATLTGSRVRVSLDRLVQAGQTVTITLDYTVLGAGRGFYANASQDPGRTIATTNWPYFARFWLPCNDHPSDDATFSFLLRVPPDSIGAANGVLVDGDLTQGSGLDGEGLRVFRWRQDVPIPVYAAAVVIGPLSVSAREACIALEGSAGKLVDCSTDSTARRLPLVHFARRNLTPGEMQGFTLEIDRAADAAARLSGLLGPYPFAKLGFSTAPHPFPGTMEYASLIALNDPIYATHELIHSWWGNAVRIATWGDFWISEGFTTYFTQYVDDQRSGTIRQWNSRAGNLVYPPDADPWIIYTTDGGPYDKGASAIHNLRGRLATAVGLPTGDPKARLAFESAIRDVWTTYRDRPLGSSELAVHLKAKLGRFLTEAGAQPTQSEVDRLVDDWWKEWMTFTPVVTNRAERGLQIAPE